MEALLSDDSDLVVEEMKFGLGWNYTFPTPRPYVFYFSAFWFWPNIPAWAYFGRRIEEGPIK